MCRYIVFRDVLYIVNLCYCRRVCYRRVISVPSVWTWKGLYWSNSESSGLSSRHILTGISYPLHHVSCWMAVPHSRWITKLPVPTRILFNRYSVIFLWNQFSTISQKYRTPNIIVHTHTHVHSTMWKWKIWRTRFLQFDTCKLLSLYFRQCYTVYRVPSRICLSSTWYW